MSYPRPRRIAIDEAGIMHCPACGCLLDDVRSDAHHRGFFAYLAFSFKHWPEAGFEDFWPDNSEHLRAWVEVRAGHRKPPRIYTFQTRAQALAAANFAVAEKAADKLEGRYSWVIPLKGQNGFEVVRPASIKWEALGEAKFGKLSREVFEILHGVVGISFTEWKEGAHRAHEAA